ncbi:MAG: hypothetical protein CXX72_02970, partial [Methanobacteriota archaeon]
DFDDHPHHGGHEPVPEGELRFSVSDEAITIGDDRLTFRLGLGVEGEDSTHRWTVCSMRMNDGPERLGEHRWSLSPAELGGQLTGFVNGCIGIQELDLPMVEERSLFASLRNRLQPILPGWTWHLEVDNKPDRMGWYVRAPADWDSLFTIFVGLGWHPDSAEDRTGFLLFERAPPGELDRADEHDSNRLDSLRTVALCNEQRGALSALAVDPTWSHRPEPHLLPDLPGRVELWPPSMGRWPLLVARSEPDLADGDVTVWAAAIVSALQPAISTLSSRIDGLSWR